MLQKVRTKLMKKILSIGNLFVKRIGLVAILLATIGVGDVWAKAKSTVNATANPSSGAGTAQVSINATSGFGPSATRTTGGTFTTSDTHEYYLKATTTSAAWLWKGWYNNGVLAVSAQTSNIQVRGTASIGGGSSYTYTATWLQPKVTGTTAGEDGGTNIKNYVFGPYTDPNVGSETRDVVFTLESNESGLIAKDGTVPTQHFTEALSGSWTANTFVKNSSDFPGIDQSSYTYNVTYKLSGVHGTNVTAKIKVASKYGSTNCTAQLMATEDYMPYFNYAYTEYNYTPTNPLAEGESLAQTFNVSKNCYAANNGVWSISLPADAAAKGFTLQTAADNPNATVQFEALPGMNKADLTTTLTAVCTYTDAKGTKVTYTQTIHLSGDAGKVITIDGAEVNTMTFDIDYAASGESTQTLPFETTLTDLTTTPSNLPAGDFITYTTWVAGLTEVSASVKHNLTPGQYTPSIKYSYNNDEVYSTLNIVANIRLAQPVVTAVNGLGQSIGLSWQTVYGATSYIVKSGETVLATIGDDEAIATTYRVTNIGGKSLVMGREYPFTVTAVYNTAEHFGTRISNEIIVTPTVPNTITASTDFDLYTGTEKYQEGHATYGKYPYSPKREINLSAAFNNGVAAFNQLFVFGMTIGDANNVITIPTRTTNSNAVTPCYVYTKSGDDYVLSSSIDNVNIATKPTEFNIAANGQKVYFTGYAPYASCGYTWKENAVFLFTGKSKTVDVYFDNLELYARPKAETGTIVPVKQYTANSVQDAGDLVGDDDVNFNLFGGTSLDVYVQGSGAAFAFASTGGTLTPTIHLNGTNVLQSTSGVSVRVTSSLLSVDATATQQSSPVQVLIKKDGGSTTLTVTDTWFDANTHTNGILDLAKSGVRPAPTIDLGSENTTLIFNGGQYFLANAGNTSTAYTVSYAISYRKKSMASGMANMYGVGDDQPEGKVRFNDGSVSCAELPAAYFNADLYHNRTSMKCPQDTKIDGGTFNCDVLACTGTKSKGGSPTNSAGKSLCEVSVPIQETNSNGTAVLASDWMTYAANHGANTLDLSYYGIKSMQPTTIINDNEEEVPGVKLLLPSDNVCFMEVNRTPWVLCIPTVSVNQSVASVSLGGSKQVPSSVTAGDEGLTHVQLTSRLFYGELDEYTKEIASGDYKTPGGADVSLPDDGAQEYVLNTGSYVIKDKVYFVRPVVANEWRMFVPPFDVANIYIVEAYPEQKLLADYGDGKTISDADTIYAARLEQATRMLDFIYFWLFDSDPAALGNDNDLWPKKGWDMSPFVRDWVDYEKETYGDADQPIIEQLYHFTGDNWEANYYLYESDGNWDYVDGKFVTDWQLVSTQSVERGKGTPQTIMRKGGIYSMCFPYSIYNEGHNPETTWDYWTGKYIIMEGYPTEEVDVIGSAQVLSGTTSDWNGDALTKTLLADHTATGASLRGNHTFGNVRVEKDNAFYLNVNRINKNRYTNSSNPRLMEPGEGFLLANAGTVPLSMPNRKASIDLMSGVVTYEPVDGIENTVTGTPTISGEREMLVYTLAGGLGVVPVVSQQVSIYNAAGQLVVSQYLTSEMQIALPAGIYLVRGEKDQVKVMVK